MMAPVMSLDVGNSETLLDWTFSKEGIPPTALMSVAQLDNDAEDVRALTSTLPLTLRSCEVSLGTSEGPIDSELEVELKQHKLKLSF